MSRTALSVALATVLFAWGHPAFAAVSGHCTYVDEDSSAISKSGRHSLVDGVAWVVVEEEEQSDDEFAVDGPRQPYILLVLTTFMVDGGAVQRATDREDAMRDQSFAADDAAKLELTLSPGTGVTSQYLWISPGMNLSNSSSAGVGEYTPKAVGKDRIAGTYHFVDEDDGQPECQVTFDVPLLGSVADAPPLPGKPLPADGGEPGKLYLALNRALLAGDLDALEKLLPPEDAADLRKSRTQPDFPAQLAMMQALTAQKVRLKGGRIDGDKAWIEFDAEEGGMPRSGTVEMARVDGKWRVLKESTWDRDR
jgi:hypothetical protein